MGREIASSSHILIKYRLFLKQFVPVHCSLWILDGSFILPPSGSGTRRWDRSETKGSANSPLLDGLSCKSRIAANFKVK